MATSIGKLGLRNIGTGLGIALLPWLCGCSTVMLKLGRRVSLEKTPVVSMTVAMDGNRGVAPGEKAGMIATFTEPNGKVLVSEGKGKGKVLWRDIAMMSTVVSVTKHGNVKADPDPRVTEGKLGHISLSVKSQPAVHAEMDVPIRYDYPFTAIYSGSSGFSGTDGTAGTDGSSGTQGSFDPDHPSGGGNGGDGTDGTNGGDGGRGGDAPDLRVLVTLRAGAPPLLEAEVVPDRGTPKYFLIDPQGGSLTVRANGGAGGGGGRGGRGGRGGSGGAGIPPGSSGHDGRSGSDGSDGPPGSDGRIVVIYDPAARPYLSAVHAAAAQLQEEPTGPLW